MLTSPKITVRYDDLTRTMEVTRADNSPFAQAMGFDAPAVRLITLPFGFMYHGFCEDLQRWLDGELIQRALPYLSRDDRAFLTSGVVLEDLPPEEEL